jgi:hypothetical protein
LSNSSADGINIRPHQSLLEIDTPVLAIFIIQYF